MTYWNSYSPRTISVTNLCITLAYKNITLLHTTLYEVIECSVAQNTNAFVSLRTKSFSQTMTHSSIFETRYCTHAVELTYRFEIGQCYVPPYLQ